MARKRKAETPKPKEVIIVEESSEEEEEVVEEVEEILSSSEESSSDEEDDDEESSDEDVEENDDEATKRQKLRKLLEPFGKDQIIGILKDAALTDQNLFSRIIQKAESDPTQRKIFIYGLGLDATQDQLREAFQSFGEIEDCELTMEKSTGRAKGYGFVTFKTRSAAKKALKNPQKKVGSQTVSCQLAAIGTHATAGDSRNRKIFVGNVVDPHINPEKLRSFFETFGEIEEGPNGFDPVTNKPRGYAVFVYKSEDGLENALRESVKHFEGHQFTCRKFVDGYNGKNSTVKAVGSINQKHGNVGTDIMPVNPVNHAVYNAPNLSLGGHLAPQTPGVGLVVNPSLASNFSQPNINQPGFGSSGVMGAMARNYGINSISPSVIGSYGFGIHAALQGLGAVRPAAASPASVSAAARGPSGTSGMP